MKWFLIALFLEIFLTIRTLMMIGPINYFFFVIISGLVGLSLLRYHQRKLIFLSQQTADMNLMLKTTCGFLGSLLILLPGVLTDLVGALLLLSPIQKYFIKTFQGRFQNSVNAQSPFGFSGFQFGRGGFVFRGSAYSVNKDSTPSQYESEDQETRKIRDIREAEVVDIKPLESSSKKMD